MIASEDETGTRAKAYPFVGKFGRITLFESFELAAFRDTSNEIHIYLFLAVNIAQSACSAKNNLL